MISTISLNSDKSLKKLRILNSKKIPTLKKLLIFSQALALSLEMWKNIFLR